MTTGRKRTQDTRAEQLFEVIKLGVFTGKYPKGSILPKTVDLMVEYNASVNVVTKARVLLRERGVTKTVYGFNGELGKYTVIR
jgi:DNA-binding GntR family transcriptional regulator